MLKKFGYVMCYWLSWSIQAQAVTQSTWLDNRFRLDNAVDHVTFVVQREPQTLPVMLIQPDGRKYYAIKHPENVSWFQDSDTDIVSIVNPMPGPWQAVGKVSSHNKVLVLSDIWLDVDPLPHRLYQNEQLKFTARLRDKSSAVIDPHFLSHLKLSARLLPLSEEESSTAFRWIDLGLFKDDGAELDEVAGDGEFTLALSVNAPIGEYRLQLQSRNAIAIRTQEQSVFVYPSPMTMAFSETDSENHQVELSRLQLKSQHDGVVAGSLAVHVRRRNPDLTVDVQQGLSEPDQRDLNLLLSTGDQMGLYHWSGWAYATDSMTQRELVFVLPPYYQTVLRSIVTPISPEPFFSSYVAMDNSASLPSISMIVLMNTTLLLLFGGGIMGKRRWDIRQRRFQSSLIFPKD